MSGAVILVYPMRGTGAAMGSQAEEMGKEYQTENYMNAVQSAKMMIKYLNEMNSNEDMKKEYTKIIYTLLSIVAMIWHWKKKMMKKY